MNYPDLDEKMRINFFSGPKRRNSNSSSQQICAHIGSITWDGYNISEGVQNHRIQCSKCGKRFGNDLEMWNLLLYQEKMKKLLYELFFYKYLLTGVAERWGIPQDKLSKFKKSFVFQVFQQNSEIIEHKVKDLPRGVILGDETFMGSRGNSNVEILFINNKYGTLSTEPVRKGDLKQSILKAFHKIPEACRKKFKILITDGEPSYKAIAKIFGSKIVHVVQLHEKSQRGEIIISKFKKLGTHFLHYKIYTYRKAFYRDKHELKFKWEIKLIKGKVQKKRGRPRKEESMKLKNTAWRQKLQKFQSTSFQKEVSIRFVPERNPLRSRKKERWFVFIFKTSRKMMIYL